MVGTDASTFSLAGSTGVLSVGSTALSTTIGHTYALTLTAAATGTGASDASGAIPLTLTVAATCSGVAQMTALLDRYVYVIIHKKRRRLINK